MSRPRLLDLFAGAGGAGAGYHRAGFDVTGVDLAPMPRYPFAFHQGDALEYLAAHGHEFDAIHASPPCQDHSVAGRQWATAARHTGHLLFVTRAVLKEIGRPWVIENVPGAPMRADYKLCGCMFDLPGLRRERWFETSWRAYDLAMPHTHTEFRVTVAGKPGGTSKRDGSNGYGDKAAWERAMGIDWMTARELAQAIPPAYTEHIGAGLMAQVLASAA